MKPLRAQECDRYGGSIATRSSSPRSCHWMRDHRIWQGGSFRDMNWFQRRPQLYAPETDAKNLGNSK